MKNPRPPLTADLATPPSINRLLRDRGVLLSPDQGRQIFCNRALRLEEIQVIGFDMDYTLALYNQAEIDRLSRECTLANLAILGYLPQEEVTPFDDTFAMRGLMIDQELGNVLKMDRHNSVGKAYHGSIRLPADEVAEIYRQQRLGDERHRFVFVDTLFELSEVLLFAELVGALDRGAQLHPKNPTYRELWQDIRECTDRAHRDGTLKAKLLAELPRYINRDPELPRTLHRLRSSGKKLFLLTNSESYYTEHVMEYLLPGEGKGYSDWRAYFDWIFVSAQKPRFFSSDATFALADGGAETRTPQRGTVYEGGNHVDFQRVLECYPDQVLYVGDHIYHDIVHSKKGCGWRTALILRDLEQDLEIRNAASQAMREFESLNDVLFQLTKRLSYHRYISSLLSEEIGTPESQSNGRGTVLKDFRKKLIELEHYRTGVTSYLADLSATLDTAFNRYWGSQFSEGYHASLFGAQVQSYACIYTSRVTNLLYVSPNEYFHSQAVPLPHF